MLDLSTLNPPQREAVTTTEGPLLVLAGAGSPARRASSPTASPTCWSRGHRPRLGSSRVTFTNKAAGEMRERVVALSAAGGHRGLRLHLPRFGLWLLGKEHEVAELPKRFAICDAGDQLALVKRCMREVSVDDRRFDARRVLSILSRAKNEGRKRIAAEARPARGTTTTWSRPRCTRATSARCRRHAARSTSTTSSLAAVELLSHEHGGPRAHAAPASATCWWTSTRTPTVAQLELLRLLAGRGAERVRGGGRRPVPSTAGAAPR